MTDAHAKAVEAAALAMFRNRWRHYAAQCEDGESAVTRMWDYAAQDTRNRYVRRSEAAITAYLAAMRAEGWVLVRDVGEKEIPTMPFVFSQARGVELIPQRSTPQEGWNACRAAMLGGTEDER